eukprot:gene30055-32140_t
MINVNDHVTAAVLPTAAARGAVLAALGDDALEAKELDDAYASTSTLVTGRGGAMGTGVSLGGVLQRSPGGEFSACVVAGAVTREQHATLSAFANTMVGAWRRMSAAGHIQLAKVPAGAPYEAYYMVLGRGGVDPLTCGLTEGEALTDMGDVGAALTQVASDLTTGDDHPPAGDVVHIIEILKAKGAAGTVTIDPPARAWISGLCPLPLRAFKPGRAAQIGTAAEGVRLTDYDGTVLSVVRRRVADGLEVGYELRAPQEVKDRAGLAQRIAAECIKVSNANIPAAASVGWTAFELRKAEKAEGAPPPALAG